MKYLVLRDTPKGLEARICIDLDALNAHVANFPPDTHFARSIPNGHSILSLHGGHGAIIYNADLESVAPRKIPAATWEVPS